MAEANDDMALAPAPVESLMLESIKLPRGGVVVSTSIGPVQMGMPPETIKDSMKLGLPVPRHYIVPSEPFTKTLGANMGVNVAEFEFPAYCNFFFKRQCVNLIVTSQDVEKRIRQVFQETLFGPATLDLRLDFPHSTPPSMYPDLKKELEYFRKFGDTLITLDMLLKFTHFNELGEAWIVQNDQKVLVKKEDRAFVIIDGHKSVTLADGVELPPPPALDTIHDSFYPPAFGVTVLGSSHGFDPHGKTSGYVLWINHRGIMIDPPPFSSSILIANNIPALMIDGVILTHCHADHDAGTFQKILQEGRVSLITTNTIYRSFLRKYSALSGFEEDFLKRVLDYRYVRINDPTTIRGAEFRFFYSLHSIPCVGFEVRYGDKRIVFSGDHLNDVDRINQLHKDGVLSKHRCEELLNFPWHCDAILHEAGVPPIHTPLKTLMNLDENIRKRVYVVHTAAKDVPPESGLRGAPEGVHNTITLDTKLPENSGALEILDLVRKIDLFAELTLNNAYEILQMARKVNYPKGCVVKEAGDVGDTFYIIIVGEAQALYRPDIAGSHSPPSHSSHSPEKIGHSQSRSSINRKRVSMLSLSKKFIPGDYFDLQNLLTPNWILPYQMVAVTKLSLLEFNAVDFNWFLRRTSAYARIQKLSESRLNFSYDIIEANQVFRKLTPSQRTMLEIVLNQKEVKAGQVVWGAGEKCTHAIIIDKGQFVLKWPRPTTPDGSQAPSTPPSSGRRSARNSSNRILPLDMSVIAKNEDQTEKVLSHGSFAGDVDKLISTEEMTHTTSLVCNSAGLIFYILKNDLQMFLLENPGILMSLGGRRYRAPEPSMERPSRRSSAQHAASHSTTMPLGNGTAAGGGRRRNRSLTAAAAAPGSQSDGAETDSSTVASDAAPHARRGSANRQEKRRRLLADEVDAANALDDGSKRGRRHRSDRKAKDADAADGRDRGVDDDEEEEGHFGDGEETDSAISVGDKDARKRERSLSNVSTASTGSSGASENGGEGGDPGDNGEGVDAAAREQMQLEKLKELEKKKKMVLDGTFAEYCRRVTEFKEEKSRLLQTAEWHKNLQLKNSQDLYGFEVQRAHDIWKEAKTNVKSDMLGRVDKLVAKLKQELATLTNSEEVTTVPAQLHSDEEKESSETTQSTEEQRRLKMEAGKEHRVVSRWRTCSRGYIATMTAVKKAREQLKQAIEATESMMSLPIDDIHADLELIANDRDKATKAALASRVQTQIGTSILLRQLDSRPLCTAKVLIRVVVASTDPVKMDRRRLFCDKYIFEEGDEVVVSSAVLQADYMGTISSIADDAVFVRLSSGQKVRIYLALLQHMRCEIKPFLRGTAGLSSLQTTGWAACEPF
ncbi:TPA: hypothetical protein N0F65_002971 [Lagenidium giganteum]|uniref:Cyclic nucleotide-binding domain-containing protein n=1 Tax=Lagenidium giganteum TaxID=4803 RepID=A0AAV2YJB1_9STRA|nr:TPA: hypothetical protein N0F65_002971 [Lagenidium giganteum]